MIRHLIFDMDGTLVDSCVICLDILGSMLAERGSDHVIDPDDARPWMSLGGQQMVAALLGPAGGDPVIDLAEFRARYRQVVTPREALFPGVQDGLALLHKAGFTLSICSNKPQNLCEQVLKDTGLDGMFNVVVGGQPGLRSKPESDLLDATVERLAGWPSDCLCIGDSELDHKVSQTARIPFMFMTYGYAEAGWRPQDSECFESFSELTEAIFTTMVGDQADPRGPH